MYKNLNIVFEKHLPKLKYDTKLYKEFKAFRLRWAQKSDEYVQFLGSNLVGVHPVRFSKQDEDMFWSILGVDPRELKKDLHSVEGINKNFKISSNPFNLTCSWLWHKFITSPNINDKDRWDAVKEVYFLFGYKITCSLIFHYFNAYNASTSLSIAKAVNERLTKQFLLRKFGSWQELFEYRAHDILPARMGYNEKEEGLHYQKAKKYNDSEDIVAMINDLQGRMKEIVKNVAREFYIVVETNERIGNISNIESDEDGDKVKTITNGPTQYINYLSSVIAMPSDLIMDDLITLVDNIFKSIKGNIIKECVLQISKQELKVSTDICERLLSIVIPYLATKDVTHDYSRQLGFVITAIKGMLANNFLEIPGLEKLKADTLKIVKTAIPKGTSPRHVSSYVNAALCYLAILPFVKLR